MRYRQPARARRRPSRRRISPWILAPLVLLTVGSPSSPAAGSLPRGLAIRTAGPKQPTQLPTLGAIASSWRGADVGDPSITTITDAGNSGRTEYVLHYTTDWVSNVPSAVSTDLRTWHRLPDALPVLPTWARKTNTMTWGPTLHHVRKAWVLYFSTEDARSREECIGAATSPTPFGPFTDRSTSPLVCQASMGGDIDPSFLDAAGNGPHLVWKNDGNADHTVTSIWEAQLSPDGLKVAGKVRRLLSANQSWEHGIIEGPAMTPASAGGFWLFYSSGSWQSATYATGLAWCATESGPCQQTTSGPYLAGSADASSPGGLDTFTGPGHQSYVCLSVFPRAPADALAGLYADRVLEVAELHS